MSRVRPNVLRAERMLTKLGYRPGKADGIADAKTTRAVNHFRRDNKALADGTGKIGKALIRELKTTLDGYEHAAYRRREIGNGKEHRAQDARVKELAGRGDGIGEGKVGGAVTRLEKHLNAAGYSVGKADNKFNGRTRAAVAAFQRENRLEQTGRVDAKTWAKLNGALFQAKGAASPAQSVGERGRVVAQVEKKLAKLGFKPGAQDGLFKQRTAEAVERFQRKHGLRVTGEVNEQTAAKLKKVYAEKFAFSKKDFPPVPNGLAQLNRVFGKAGTNIVSTRLPLGKDGAMVNVSLNKKLVPVMKKMLADAKAKGLLKYIDSFDGMYNYRTKRGPNGASSSLSTHSWGIAFDINASQGSWGKVNPKLAAHFQKYGFVWGKSFNDPMHFQYVKGY